MQLSAVRGAPSAYCEFLSQQPTHPVSGEHRRLLSGESFIHNADVTTTETYRSGHAVYRAAAGGRCECNGLIGFDVTRGRAPQWPYLNC
jgi:hypothetical protein